MTSNSNEKPFLRGHLHQAAFFMALGACTLLILKSQPLAKNATIIYSFSLISLLGISALYHRINWNPKTRMIMRRLDHAAIYLLIAGTMTPICLLAMAQKQGKNLLIIAWIVSSIGILLSLLFPKKPKWLNATLCISAGFVIVPYLTDLAHALGNLNLSFILAGGLAYITGAVIYALKKPNFFPKVFGYHEIFHFLVVIGASSHFVVIFSLT